MKSEIIKTPRADRSRAFAIDRHTGKLRTLNTVASRGADPCHLTVDKTGKPRTGSELYRRQRGCAAVGADGMLGQASDFVQHLGSSVNPERQHEPHAHDIVLTPDNRFAIVADLGLDKLLVYRYDPGKGKLSAPTIRPSAT